jgi:hypothetical protein
MTERIECDVPGLGQAVLHAKFIIGCLCIVSGMAWPTVSITRGLTTYSHVCRSAVRERREVEAPQKQEIIAAVENASSSILGGFLMGLFGIGLALGTKRDEPAAHVDTSGNA